MHDGVASQVASWSRNLAAGETRMWLDPLREIGKFAGISEKLRRRRKNAGLLGRRSWRLPQQCKCLNLLEMAGSTRLELATSGVTGRRSNQLNYDP